MVAAALDTYRIVKRLRDVGFSDAQAETVTDVLTEASGNSLAELATKADLAALRADLKGEIAALKTELKADLAALKTELKADLAAVEARLDSLEQRMNAKFESLEQRMTIKLGGMLVAGIAAVAVLVKLL